MFYNCSKIVGAVNLVGGDVHTHSSMDSLIYNVEHELPFERVLAQRTDSSPTHSISANYNWPVGIIHQKLIILLFSIFINQFCLVLSSFLQQTPNYKPIQSKYSKNANNMCSFFAYILRQCSSIFSCFSLFTDTNLQPYSIFRRHVWTKTLNVLTHSDNSLWIQTFPKCAAGEGMFSRSKRHQLHLHSTLCFTLSAFQQKTEWMFRLIQGFQNGCLKVLNPLEVGDWIIFNDSTQHFKSSLHQLLARNNYLSDIQYAEQKSASTQRVFHDWVCQEFLSTKLYSEHQIPALHEFDMFQQWLEKPCTVEEHAVKQQH